MSTKQASKTPAVRTEDLPAQVLGVKRTVTKAQALAFFQRGELERMRGVIALKFLTERGKVKSVRAAAEEAGISKSTIHRIGQAAALVWQIGAGANETDAKAAMQLVNALGKGKAVGPMSDYLDAKAEGSDMSKALRSAAKVAATKARESERAAIAASTPAPSGDTVEGTVVGTPQSRAAVDTSTVQVTADDASRVKAAAATLAKVSNDVERVSAEDAQAALAHALRIAIVALPWETISAEIANAVGANAENNPAKEATRPKRSRKRATASK